MRSAKIVDAGHGAESLVETQAITLIHFEIPSNVFLMEAELEPRHNIRPKILLQHSKS